MTFQFQSTLPVWGATGLIYAHPEPGTISIHAPRVGSDRYVNKTGPGDYDFNPRSPCGERRGRISAGQHQRISIHAPRVGSDPGELGVWPVSRDFNPRSPCGERPPRQRKHYGGSRFQSTLPVWGATVQVVVETLSKEISIHAPRVGSDRFPSLSRKVKSHFNPRSPCGERLHAAGGEAGGDYFNPRSPCGERRDTQGDSSSFGTISIHAPRVGSDNRPRWLLHHLRLFQSTLPVWGATDGVYSLTPSLICQSTLPVWGATFRLHRVPQPRPCISIHAPRVGSDRWS